MLVGGIYLGILLETCLGLKIFYAPNTLYM